MKNEEMQKRLFVERKSGWVTGNPSKIFDFAGSYMDFMRHAKTERLAVANIREKLSGSGFKPIREFKALRPGDRFYKEIKSKTIIAGVVGKTPGEFRLVGSHVDSPRLDLKPNPLYEDSSLAMLQTHYYGGVKKYQWVNVPLELHGIIYTKAGKKVELSIGSKEGDPVFVIPDIEPHLSSSQMERTAKKIVEGEELNVLVGNIPIDDPALKEQVKFAILSKLYKEHGLIEEDFTTSEIELVPAYPPRELGMDRSMIGAYGQDDKVCVYASLQALLEVRTPSHTAIALFVDKEEIGSVGDTGAAGFMLINFAEEYIDRAGLKVRPFALLESSKAISADVTVAMNPNFKDVNDPQNVSYLGKGVAVEKYGGSGGKYYTNDAHAEYFNEIRQLAIKNKIRWQTGELGKIDIGGGGTIGMFLSRYGMDCIDAGPPTLGMHSPFEVTSKADLYSSYLLYKAFLNS